MPFWRDIQNTLGIETNRAQPNAGELLDAEIAKRRVTMLGIMGAGKTTFASMILKAAQRRASKTRDTLDPFKVLPFEGSTNLIDDTCMLRIGRFPRKTEAFRDLKMEANFRLEWKHYADIGAKIPLWTKRASLPVCDFAGEEVVQLIDKVSQATNLGQIMSDRAMRLTDMMCNSSGYIIILKATQLTGLGRPLEAPPMLNGMSQFTDANMTKLITKIVDFKRKHPNSPPIEGIAVVITAYDALDAKVKEIEALTGEPFDPLNDAISQQSLDKLVYACFPSTHATIASLGLKNVQYFPSYCIVEKDASGHPLLWDEEPGLGTPRIKLRELLNRDYKWEDNVNTIEDSEKSTFKVLDWLQDFATLR